VSKKLLIIGAKGMAKRALDAIEEQQEYSEIALLDGYADYDQVYSYPIIGSSDDVEKLRQDYSHAIVCIADTKTRLHFLNRVMAVGFEVPNIIHPRAYVSKSVAMGVGIIVNAMAAIQSDTKIGNGCVIETGAVVEHDNEFGECVTISPNASTMGYIKIGNCTYVAGGACVVNAVCIGENVLVAAGSVVISDTPDNVMVAGCPAVIKGSVEEMKHMIWPGVYPEGKF